MKQWTVYYRGSKGQKTSLVIEADDRDGVFLQLKERGISAISVVEGADNIAKGGMVFFSKKCLFGICSVALLIAIILGCRWVISQKEVLVIKTERCEKTAERKEAANLVTNQVQDTLKAETSATTNLPPQKVGEVRNGMVLLPNGKLHRRRGLKKSFICIIPTFEILDISKPYR